MFPLRILGRVIADIDLQGGCSDYTRILFVLRFTQFDALDGNSGETGRRINTFLPLIATRGQRFRRFGSRNSAPDILILEMMLIILLQIVWIVYWLCLRNYFLGRFQSINCILYWPVNFNDNLWGVIGRAERLHDDWARGGLVMILRGRAQRYNVIFFQVEDVFVTCGGPRLFVKVLYSRWRDRNLVNLLFH